MYLDVYLRSCSRIVAVNNTPRPLGMPKAELSLRCISSLVNSMKVLLDSMGQYHPPRNFQLALTIIDDHSDPMFLEAVSKILAHAPFRTTLNQLESSGNGASLRQTYELAREAGGDLIFFVEDDYLLEANTLRSMVEAFDLGKRIYGKDVCIFPCDYIDLYRPPKVSKLYLGKDRYWRQVESTTGTVMVTSKILNSHWHCFMGLARYDIDPWVNEQNTINLVYKDHPCLSPMPSLAIHMHEGIQSPYVPWRQWLVEAGQHTEQYLSNKSLGIHNNQVVSPPLNDPQNAPLETGHVHS